MKKTAILAALVPAAMLGTQAAQASNTALGLKLGTLGGGIELTQGFTDNLNGRIGFNNFSYDYEETEDGIDYDGDLDFETFSALLDWHPFGGGFRISAGAYNNGNEIDATATGTDDYDIGDQTYTIDNARLDLAVDFDDFAPYLGIGWGDAVDQKGHVTFGLDIGVLYQGSPEASLSAQGTIGGQDVNDNAQFREDLRREEEQLNNDLEDFEYYPVISVGLNYRF